MSVSTLPKQATPAPPPMASRSPCGTAGSRCRRSRSSRSSRATAPAPTSGAPRSTSSTTRSGRAYGERRRIAWLEVLAGEKAKDRLNSWLPDETLAAIDQHLVAIKGPLTTPVGGGFRSLNVALRQKLDLYACVRPVRWFEGVPSPVKAPEDVNMVIFRENTEDIYAGIEYKAGTDEARRVVDFLQQQMGAQTIRFPDTSAIGIKPISEEGSKRLIRSAIEYAARPESCPA